MRDGNKKINLKKVKKSIDISNWIWYNIYVSERDKKKSFLKTFSKSLDTRLKKCYNIYRERAIQIVSVSLGWELWLKLLEWMQTTEK